MAQRCSNTLRERQNFCVLDSNDEANFVGSPPSCSHGPCLLFGRRSDSGDLVESFFGCAVYRSDRGCNFRMPLKGQPQHNSDSIKKSGIDFSNTKQRVSASPVHKHRLLSESHSRESTSEFSSIDDEKKTSIVNKPKFIYGIIRKHVNQLIAIGVPLYYCGYCNDAVRIPHKHPVVGPLRRHHFRKPSGLLKAITEDDGEAVSTSVVQCISIFCHASK
ncbi:unnamed protein product [Anisakis simplex]|uniref:Uncharacterized protein n=1 Tax=Anisakis simplex TaxID=6269 RepID=A0A3P6P1Y8_ANISI|nr:unnamed protein product [Anisakis simplex]